ncbi:MAG: Rieske (2Fe-2S) protein [Acidimicrobiia bacterium]|nr:Rieske (2Fe-2S) protein [Acidimicrobiia bacterium]
MATTTPNGAAATAPPATEPEGRYPFGIPFGWFQVAWSHELERGQVLPRYYFGRHLVLWRDEEGVAHLNDAFCPHLGAHLGHGGSVIGTDLACPFHGWRFCGDGTNTAIPYSERTNARATIGSYPLVELGDHFLYAWFHPHGDEPHWPLHEPEELHDPAFTDWSTRHFSVAAATQELGENAVDGPHFRYVHNTEIVPEIQSYDTEGHVASMRSIQRFPTPRGVVDGRIDVDNHGPGMGITRFSGIVDTFLIGAAIPVDATRCEVRFSFKVRRLDDGDATSGVGKAFISEVCKQLEEDRPIWENKAHLTRPALADTDPPFLKFRKWYAQFYADAPDTTSAVWTPPPPTDGQPVYLPPEATASRRHRPDDVG